MDKFSKDLGKKAAALHAVGLVQSGMTLGIGSGSTSEFFIDFLIKRFHDEKLHILAVPTSEKSKILLEQGNIPIIHSEKVDHLDLDIDGADEITYDKQMIKGGGGALLREKIVAYMSEEMIVIIDESKKVQNLGKFPLPVEIVPFAMMATIKHLKAKGFNGKIRHDEKNEIFITDNGNYIFDIYFENAIDQPIEVEKKIKEIPGVVETGLFLKMAGRVIVGFNNGNIEVF